MLNTHHFRWVMLFSLALQARELGRRGVVTSQWAGYHPGGGYGLLVIGRGLLAFGGWDQKAGWTSREVQE